MLQKLVTFFARPGALLTIFALSVFGIVVACYRMVEIETKKASTYEVFALIVSIATLAVYALTLFVIAYQMRQDHERRRKQATIEHIEKIRAAYRQKDHWLESLLKNGDDKDVIDPNKLTEEHKKDLRDLLAVVEHMSTGILIGVFDFELFDRMSGAFFIRLHKRLKPFIDKTRDEKGSSSTKIYEDFSTLIARVNEHRKPKIAANKQGVISA
jgi:Domain of unknown function (DUF4760)